MPIKKKYKRLVIDNIKCPKCSRPKDNEENIKTGKEYITCKVCRESKSKTKERNLKDKETRIGMMSLFGIRPYNE